MILIFTPNGVFSSAESGILEYPDVLSDAVVHNAVAAGQFTIPRGAWQRSIGDYPYPAASNDPNRGIVLGGFGAGAFMYNISGSFGPWADEVGSFNNSRLLGAAFHIYEKQGDNQPLVKCLSTDTVMMSAWDQIAVGDGTYYALQPKGWCVYDCFTTEVQTQFFSPIIAHNYRETSYPVAVWQFSLVNPTAEATEVSIMFTWPNPPFNNGRRTRRGFFNSLNSDPSAAGIILRANHPANTPETQNTEWCLAVQQGSDQVISYSTWDPAGDGGEVWGEFADDGVLSNQINPFDSAAAIAIKVTLAPGEERVVPVALAWDYPVVEFGNADAGQHSTQWWKRYCEYFDTTGNHSFDIAAEALQNNDSWSAEVDAWMTPFLDDPRYPSWLLCAAFNEMYYCQFGGSFWESGLRSGHAEEFMGLHEEDNKNFVMESQVYTLSGNVSVGHYSSITYARFWPEMERDLLRCHADIVLYYDDCNPTALYQVSAEIGAPVDYIPGLACNLGDPFFVVDPHNYLSRPAPCAPGVIHVETEMSSKFIQRCWRYYSLTDDLEFLEYIWPAAESTYQFMKTYDCGAVPDSLPDAQGYDNTYDGWAMYGTDIYAGGFWVGALQTLDTMAALLNKPVRGEIQAWLEAAQRNLDLQLWDKAEQYYHVDTESDYPEALFADGLGGQRYNEAYGLPDILPRARMDAHLQKVYDVCVVPNADFGARLGRMPDGTTVPGGDRDTYEYWVGTSYYVAASMYRAGMRTEALNTAYGAFYPVWEADHLAYWFNTPEAWKDDGLAPRPGPFSFAKGADASAPGETQVVISGDDGWNSTPHQYQRARAVWELIFEMQQAAPNTPTLFLPGDFAYLADSTPTFTWSATVAPQGSYRLQYARDIGFSFDAKTIEGITDTVFTMPDSLAFYDAVWFWRVEAIDQNNRVSGWPDEPFSFSLDTGMPCDCTYLGDIDGDQEINPVDVVYLVTYVYRAGIPAPPPIPNCPAVNGDWNCDNMINPVDVVLMVNDVYRGAQAGPCSPCN